MPGGGKLKLFSTHFFPLWVIIFSAIAFILPSLFVDLKNSIIPLLMLIMISMGMTLNWQDFLAVWRQKSAVFLGVSIQFIIMPLAAFLLAKGFNLSTELTIGLMLVGTTAGGTASNVMAYLAKGDVALSVSMTLVSTLLAVLLLPLLMWFYLRESVDVPVLGMLTSLLKIILLPIIIGMILNYFFHTKIQKIQPLLPIFSMLSIVLIIAIVVALNQNNLNNLVWVLIAVVILHNLLGLSAGYGFAKLFGYDEKTARTLAIEVGMQNSGLSVALSMQYFTPLAALPGAMFSIWHNISGSIIAAYWQKRK